MHVPFPRIGKCVAIWYVAVSFSVVAALCFALAGIAHAEQETGSITLQLGGETQEQPAFVGGKIALYCVATVDRSNGARYDVSKGQFSNMDVVAGIPSMSSEQLDEQNANISAKLEKQAKTSSLSPLMSASIEQGSAMFSSVPEGLYLLVQTELSQGNRKMNAFMMSIPDKNGQLNVVAQPKPGIDTPEPEPNPDKPNEPDDDGSENTDSASRTANNKTASNTNTGSATSSTTTPSITYRVPQTGDSVSTSTLALLLAIGAACAIAGALGRFHTRNRE